MGKNKEKQRGNNKEGDQKEEEKTEKMRLRVEVKKAIVERERTKQEDNVMKKNR